MVQGKTPPPAAAECKNPLEQNVALGRDLGINGTPTIIFADGSRASGALPIAMIEQRMASKR
jgi:thiol:disulfide interchange protein DsbC